MNTKMFKIGYGILLLFLIIYVGSLISWIFNPFVVIFETLFIPLILAGFLFYLLRPLVKIMENKLSKTISIILLFFGLICIIISLLIVIGPILQRQFYSLINSIPFIVSEIQRGLMNIQQSETIQRYGLNETLNLDGVIFEIGDLINRLGKVFATEIANIIGAVANAVLALLIVPFILFYLLKEGEKFGESVLKIFNEKKRDDIQSIFKGIDKTLSAYIQGQGIVCLCVGLLCYIIFLIVGLDYALLLGVIAGVTNIIPYFGPWIGTVPAVIVALVQSPMMGLVVLMLVAIIQQIESSIIAPQVIGKKLKIHPIIIIFLILIVGRLMGLIGMILAVPTYAILKVILVHSVQIWRLKRGS
ncbi:AI-2E family transporter [Halonatronum saccharophilum]|uniref:AI-2E family transporter n=1 Tax=Halonatronum saccharophilum TaxID=150060 RepID=UPI00048657A1|nr:AI-2E family transporter [Halonatronum saccharophilum]